jgi:hypothetical protein
MWMAAALSLALVSGYVQAGRGEIRLAVRERTCLRHLRYGLPARLRATRVIRELSCRERSGGPAGQRFPRVETLVIRGHQTLTNADRENRR